MDYIAVDADGSAGGLLLVWNPKIFTLKDCCSNRNLILLSGISNNSFGCVIINMYAPNEVANRRKQTAAAVWFEVHEQGWARCTLRKKFIVLKHKLKLWNKEVFGNVDYQLKQAEEDLHSFDLEAEKRELDKSEHKRRCEVKDLVWKLRKRKDSLWFQKSRLDWTQMGDKNTRFFHICASRRRCKNILDSVHVNVVKIEDPIAIKHEVCRYFSKLFSKTWVTRPKLSGDFKTISKIKVEEVLEAKFSEDEIWLAIKECSGNKEPGPDGFNMACIQKCWKFMKKDFVQFLKEFHLNGKLVKGINNSFIALIPKKDNPSDLTD
ncbi:uncharacterized protein LOC114270097 [Camellia sinensis]|uniref:uncharacterized protein LOC114270097 n=1 Tax=Camellia sinensis TaxID=4442 RepID=UPI0010367216|nr:uncharacterized protein LOC114270097 [Camellia sinensis]